MDNLKDLRTSWPHLIGVSILTIALWLLSSVPITLLLLGALGRVKSPNGTWIYLLVSTISFIIIVIVLHRLRSLNLRSGNLSKARSFTIAAIILFLCFVIISSKPLHHAVTQSLPDIEVEESVGFQIDKSIRSSIAPVSINSKAILDSLKTTADSIIIDSIKHSPNVECFFYFKQDSIVVRVFKEPWNSIRFMGIRKNNIIIDMAEYYLNGQYMCKFEFDSLGNQHGKYLCYYEDGRIRVECEMVHGHEKSSVKQRYNKDGYLIVRE